MKKLRFLPVILVPLLFSCAPKKIEIPMTEVPSAELVQALDTRTRSFGSLRALAEVTVARKDRKRTFEAVAVLVSGKERFKLEAYGPLGQSVATVLWQGKDVFVDMNGELMVLPAKGGSLERILGADVDPADLCSILSGNIPGLPGSPLPKLLCAPDDSCVLELADGDRVIKAYPTAGPDRSVRLSFFEVYKGKHLMYRVRYGVFEPSAGYELPRQITVESPGKRMSLKISYAEADVNTPLDAALFIMPRSEGMGP